MAEHINCLIIGAGPAGYTAAIYAARANLKPVMYQGLEPGGQLMLTTDVENYPGYPSGVQGPEMMEDFKKQSERMGADIRYGIVTKVDFSSAPHKITIDEKEEITADAVIISTGATARWLGLESEKRLNGHGVSACAVCDGFFYKDMVVAVVGGGDTACEEALYLSKLCTKVYMFVRKDHMRASKVMQDRVIASDKIELHYHMETDEVLGDKVVEGVRMLNNQSNEKKEFKIDGFFVAIGHNPNSGPFIKYLDSDEQGYIKVQNGSTRTNVEGVFVSGDVQDKIYRQAITAGATGCMAALDAERWLSERGLV